MTFFIIGFSGTEGCDEFVIKNPPKSSRVVLDLGGNPFVFEVEDLLFHISRWTFVFWFCGRRQCRHATGENHEHTSYFLFSIHAALPKDLEQRTSGILGRKARRGQSECSRAIAASRTVGDEGGCVIASVLEVKKEIPV
jgi:hypothetical protein